MLQLFFVLLPIISSNSSNSPNFDLTSLWFSASCKATNATVTLCTDSSWICEYHLFPEYSSIYLKSKDKQWLLGKEICYSWRDRKASREKISGLCKGSEERAKTLRRANLEKKKRGKGRGWSGMIRCTNEEEERKESGERGGRAGSAGWQEKTRRVTRDRGMEQEWSNQYAFTRGG